MVMKWSPALIAKLDRVRDVRMRLAEAELIRVDQELAACRQAEEQVRHELLATTDRSAAESAQANEALLGRVAGGRMGISQWQQTRKRALLALQAARGKVDEAVSGRVGKELESASARGRWRDARFEVERLRLLAEQLGEKLE
jgi:hypothetical protein